jgi:RNA polymerase sigma factor (sigma-70 family)
MADMEEIIKLITPALRRYARTFVCDAEVADDLVQNTLEQAIRSWHRRRSDANPQIWLFSILHNLLPLDATNESEMAVSSTQEGALRHANILAAVGKLPDDQRCILLLVSVEDVSYADAARILDIPIGTVMARLAHARERLVKLGEEQGNKHPADLVCREFNEPPLPDRQPQSVPRNVALWP